MLKNILFSTLLVLIAFQGTSQFDPSLYDKYYEALNNGNHKKAKKELEKISLKESNQYMFALTKANYYSETDQLDSAEYYLSQALSFVTNGSISYSSSAFKRHRDSLYAKAVLTMDKIIERSPNADAYHRRALFKMEIGLLEGAIADFTKTLDSDGNDAVTYYNMGLAYRRLNQLDSALVSYDRAIALDPYYSEAHLNKGFAYIHLEKYHDAIKEFNRAIDLPMDAGGFSYTLNNLGYCHYKLKAYEDARFYIDKSLQINALNSYAFRNLALLEIAEGNTNAACEAISESIELGFVNEYGDEILELQREHCSKD